LLYYTEVAMSEMYQDNGKRKRLMSRLLTMRLSFIKPTYCELHIRPLYLSCTVSPTYRPDCLRWFLTGLSPTCGSNFNCLQFLQICAPWNTQLHSFFLRLQYLSISSCLLLKRSHLHYRFEVSKVFQCSTKIFVTSLIRTSLLILSKYSISFSQHFLTCVCVCVCGATL
jgi:hypothetical protein